MPMNIRTVRVHPASYHHKQHGHGFGFHHIISLE
jgi:hypothetical protein